MAFVPSTRLDAARAFFGDVLGLRLTSADDFGLMFDAGGTALRVPLVEQLTPAPYTIFGWMVDDIDATVDGLTQRGVEMTRYGLDFMQQDARGIWAAPGGARIAWFKDPAGNTLSVTQSA
jgi:predicted enzyme related to lactoylglutathione lyase